MDYHLFHPSLPEEILAVLSQLEPLAKVSSELNPNSEDLKQLLQNHAICMLQLLLDVNYEVNVSDDAKKAMEKSLKWLHGRLQNLVGDVFQQLSGIAKAPWTDPTIVRIVKNMEVASSDIDKCLRNEGHRLLQSRIQALYQYGCHEEAVNLALCCSNHPVFGEQKCYLKTALWCMCKQNYWYLVKDQLKRMSCCNVVEVIREFEKEDRQSALNMARQGLVLYWSRVSPCSCGQIIAVLWIRMEMKECQSDQELIRRILILKNICAATSDKNLSHISDFVKAVASQVSIEVIKQLAQPLSEFCLSSMKSVITRDNSRVKMKKRSENTKVVSALLVLFRRIDYLLFRDTALTYFAVNPNTQTYKWMCGIFTSKPEEFGLSAEPVVWPVLEDVHRANIVQRLKMQRPSPINAYRKWEDIDEDCKQLLSQRNVPMLGAWKVQARKKTVFRKRRQILIKATAKRQPAKLSRAKQTVNSAVKKQTATLPVEKPERMITRLQSATLRSNNEDLTSGSRMVLPMTQPRSTHPESKLKTSLSGNNVIQNESSTAEAPTGPHTSLVHEKISAVRNPQEFPHPSHHLGRQVVSESVKGATQLGDNKDQAGSQVKLTNIPTSRCVLSKRTPEKSTLQPAGDNKVAHQYTTVCHPVEIFSISYSASKGQSDVMIIKPQMRGKVPVVLLERSKDKRLCTGGADGHGSVMLPTGVTGKRKAENEMGRKHRQDANPTKDASESLSGMVRSRDAVGKCTVTDQSQDTSVTTDCSGKRPSAAVCQKDAGPHLPSKGNHMSTNIGKVKTKIWSPVSVQPVTSAVNPSENEHLLGTVGDIPTENVDTSLSKTNVGNCGSTEDGVMTISLAENKSATRDLPNSDADISRLAVSQVQPTPKLSPLKTGPGEVIRSTDSETRVQPVIEKVAQIPKFSEATMPESVADKFLGSTADSNNLESTVVKTTKSSDVNISGSADETNWPYYNNTERDSVILVDNTPMVCYDQNSNCTCYTDNFDKGVDLQKGSTQSQLARDIDSQCGDESAILQRCHDVSEDYFSLSPVYPNGENQSGMDDDMWFDDAFDKLDVTLASDQTSKMMASLLEEPEKTASEYLLPQGSTSDQSFPESARSCSPLANAAEPHILASSQSQHLPSTVATPCSATVTSAELNSTNTAEQISIEPSSSTAWYAEVTTPNLLQTQILDSIEDSLEMTNALSRTGIGESEVMSHCEEPVLNVSTDSTDVGELVNLAQSASVVEKFPETTVAAGVDCDPIIPSVAEESDQTDIGDKCAKVGFTDNIDDIAIAVEVLTRGFSLHQGAHENESIEESAVGITDKNMNYAADINSFTKGDETLKLQCAECVGNGEFEQSQRTMESAGTDSSASETGATLDQTMLGSQGSRKDIKDRGFDGSGKLESNDDNGGVCVWQSCPYTPSEDEQIQQMSVEPEVEVNTVHRMPTHTVTKVTEKSLSDPQLAVEEMGRRHIVKRAMTVRRSPRKPLSQDVQDFTTKPQLVIHDAPTVKSDVTRSWQYIITGPRVQLVDYRQAGRDCLKLVTGCSFRKVESLTQAERASLIPEEVNQKLDEFSVQPQSQENASHTEIVQTVGDSSTVPELVARREKAGCLEMRYTVGNKFSAIQTCTQAGKGDFSEVKHQENVSLHHAVLSTPTDQRNTLQNEGKVEATKESDPLMTEDEPEDYHSIKRRLRNHRKNVFQVLDKPVIQECVVSSRKESVVNALDTPSDIDSTNNDDISQAKLQHAHNRKTVPQILDPVAKGKSAIKTTPSSYRMPSNEEPRKSQDTAMRKSEGNPDISNCAESKTLRPECSEKVEDLKTKVNIHQLAVDAVPCTVSEDDTVLVLPEKCSEDSDNLGEQKVGELSKSKQGNVERHQAQETDSGSMPCGMESPISHPEGFADKEKFDETYQVDEQGQSVSLHTLHKEAVYGEHVSSESTEEKKEVKEPDHSKRLIHEVGIDAEASIEGSQAESVDGKKNLGEISGPCHDRLEGTAQATETIPLHSNELVSRLPPECSDEKRTVEAMCEMAGVVNKGSEATSSVAGMVCRSDRIKTKRKKRTKKRYVLSRPKKRKRKSFPLKEECGEVSNLPSECSEEKNEDRECHVPEFLQKEPNRCEVQTSGAKNVPNTEEVKTSATENIDDNRIEYAEIKTEGTNICQARKSETSQSLSSGVIAMKPAYVSDEVSESEPSQNRLSQPLEVEAKERVMMESECSGDGKKIEEVCKMEDKPVEESVASHVSGGIGCQIDESDQMQRTRKRRIINSGNEKRGSKRGKLESEDGARLQFECSEEKKEVGEPTVGELEAVDKRHFSAEEGGRLVTDSSDGHDVKEFSGSESKSTKVSQGRGAESKPRPCNADTPRRRSKRIQALHGNNNETDDNTDGKSLIETHKDASVQSVGISKTVSEDGSKKSILSSAVSDQPCKNLSQQLHTPCNTASLCDAKVAADLEGPVCVSISEGVKLLRSRRAEGSKSRKGDEAKKEKPRMKSNFTSDHSYCTKPT